uniref:ArsR family transcriptional regulator n=1 Tax=Archaeoglobus fulgidus TaxID=2234 RepID=A0A7J2TKS7_ARCFL
MQVKCDEHLKCTLKCAFNVSCLDMDVFVALMKKNPATVEELAEMLGKDKSTIYKSLKKLLELGLIERDYRIIRSGGYRYLYRPIPYEEFKVKMMKALEQWIGSLTDFLQSLEKIEKEKLESALVKT